MIFYLPKPIICLSAPFKVGLIVGRFREVLLYLLSPWPFGADTHHTVFTWLEVVMEVQKQAGTPWQGHCIAQGHICFDSDLLGDLDQMVPMKVKEVSPHCLFSVGGRQLFIFNLWRGFLLFFWFIHGDLNASYVRYKPLFSQQR